MLEKFKVPIFDKYNSKKDPKSHLWQFDGYLQIQQEHKNLVAKLFKDTLIINATAWYNNLLINSINSLNEHKKAFLAHYIHNAYREIDFLYLHTIK